MNLGWQILEGAMYLAVCSVVHAVWLAFCVGRTRLRRAQHDMDLPHWRVLVLVLSFLLAVVLSHTFQVWLWAFALYQRDELTDWNAAVYFSLVTYTALGYGDVVLSPENRVFGAMAAMTGLLNFGVSTAFVVAAWTRLFGGRPH